MAGPRRGVCSSFAPCTAAFWCCLKQRVGGRWSRVVGRRVVGLWTGVHKGGGRWYPDQYWGMRQGAWGFAFVLLPQRDSVRAIWGWKPVLLKSSCHTAFQLDAGGVGGATCAWVPLIAGIPGHGPWYRERTRLASQDWSRRCAQGTSIHA